MQPEQSPRVREREGRETWKALSIPVGSVRLLRDVYSGRCWAGEFRASSRELGGGGW